MSRLAPVALRRALPAASPAVAGTAIGTAAGATLGGIVGSHVTDDTYIIVAKVAFGIVRGPARRDGKTITFGRSITGHPENEDEREERRRARLQGDQIGRCGKTSVRGTQFEAVQITKHNTRNQDAPTLV